jgi:EpsI family protein
MKHPLARAAVVCLLLAATSVFLANARKNETPIQRSSFAEFPMVIGPWRAVVDPPMDPDILRMLGVDDYLSRAYYQPNGAAVGLYMGFYGSQRQGDTIHSPMNCLPGAGWEPVSEGELEIANVDGAGRNIKVNRYVIQKGLDRNVVLYWYHGRGRVVGNEYLSKAYLIRDAIIDNRTDGSLVRVIAAVNDRDTDGVASAEALAENFIRTIFPTLSPYLP